MNTLSQSASFLSLSAGLHWHSPWFLALLIVPLALIFWNPFRRTAALPLPMAPGAPPLTTSFRQRILWLPRVLRLLGMCGLILALARPQIGQGRVQTSTDAIAIQLVVDRSGSMGRQMEIDGTLTTRLDVVKRVLRDFLLGNGGDLAGRPSDLIGLVTFAQFAETNCPLIRDHRAVVDLADAVQTAQLKMEDGTAIGEGLALAAARLRAAEQDLKGRKAAGQDEDFQIKSKIIILLTDGDNNAGQTAPVDAAKLAADWGIRVYTIGIGGSGFMTMRTPFGDQRVPIANEIDERTLSQIAEIGGGVYRRASDGDTLRKIYTEIDRLEKSSVKTIDFVDYKELFHAPALVGLVAIALASLLAATVLGRIPA